MRERRKGDMWGYWVLGVVAVGTALRFFRLGAKSLWVDEGYSVVVTRLGWGVLVKGVFELENHPPLYFLALKLWNMAGYPESDGYVRGLSAIVSVAIVWGVYKLGRLVFGKWEGLVGAGLAGISAYQIYFAQEARLYALVGALAVWSTYFLFRGLREEGRPRDWVAYCVLGAAALWTFYYSVFLVAAQGAAAVTYLVVKGREEKGSAAWRGWVVSQVVLMLAFAPLAVMLLSKGKVTGGGGAGVSGGALGEGLAQYAVWVGSAVPERSLVAGLTLLGIFPVWAALMGMRKKWLGVTTTVMLFGLPFGMVALFPYKPFGFEGKHLFFVTPFYWVIAGFVVVRFKVAGRVACAALVACNVLALSIYYGDSYEKEDWDWAAEYVGERFGSRDAIFCEPAWGYYSFERYWLRRYAGELVRGEAYVLIDPEGELTAEALREEFSPYRRVWLVEGENAAVVPNPNVEKWLGEMMSVKMKVERKSAIGKIIVVLFQRKEGERDEDSEGEGSS